VKAIIALIMFLLSAAAYGQQMLKCTGKDGKIEYAAQCPPGTRQEATGIKSTPAPTSPASSGAPQKSLAEQNAEFTKRATEKQEAQAKEEKKTAQDAQRQRACADAQAYLKNLQAGNRIAKIDPKTGERAYLEDAGYATEIAAAQSSVDANCK
jgi:hypothetical protein